MKNSNKLIYWISTGLLTLLMLFSACMYFFAHEVAVQAFESLGYPIFLIYPLAIAKLLGLVAIWSRMSQLLKEWAYAGFFFDFVLALSAHLYVGDGAFGASLLALILWAISYTFDKKAFS